MLISELLGLYGLMTMLRVALFVVKNDVSEVHASGFESGMMFGCPVSMEGAKAH